MFQIHEWEVYMPNRLNKDRNRREQIDVVNAKNQALVLAQQIERRRRLKQLAQRNHEGVTESDHEGVTGGARTKGEQFGSPKHQWARSSEELLEETQQRLDLIEETREQFFNLSITPQTKRNWGRSTRSEGEEEAKEVEGTKAARNVRRTLHNSQGNLPRSNPSSSGTQVGPGQTRKNHVVETKTT